MERSRVGGREERDGVRKRWRERGGVGREGGEGRDRERWRNGGRWRDGGRERWREEGSVRLKNSRI